jgi:gephyrin
VTSDQSLSNDPSAGPAHRTRISNYPIILFKDALRIVLEHLAPAQPVSHPVDPNLIGYVLAEDVTAAEAVPGYRASIVDGYAVVMIFGERSIKGVFPVTSVSLASLSEGKRLGFGEIARVSTGAPVPHGTGAVVMVEDTRVKTVNKDDLHEEDEVEILTDAVKPGENIREIGSDVRLGEVVLRRGDSISSVGGELGLLASVGRHTVDVYEKAIVGVLSTGHEIVEHTVPGPLPEGQVRDSNRIAIMAAVQSWGYKVVDLGIAKDSYVWSPVFACSC